VFLNKIVKKNRPSAVGFTPLAPRSYPYILYCYKLYIPRTGANCINFIGVENRGQRERPTPTWNVFGQIWNYSGIQICQFRPKLLVKTP